VALRGLKVTNDGLVFTADERHAGVIWNMAVELLEITDVEGDRLFHAPEHRISEVVAEVFGPRPEPAS
jgi:RNase P/RNase MRP subunit p29